MLIGHTLSCTKVALITHHPRNSNPSILTTHQSHKTQTSISLYLTIQKNLQRKHISLFISCQLDDELM